MTRELLESLSSHKPGSPVLAEMLNRIARRSWLALTGQGSKWGYIDTCPRRWENYSWLKIIYGWLKIIYGPSKQRLWSNWAEKFLLTKGDS